MPPALRVTLSVLGGSRFGMTHSNDVTDVVVIGLGPGGGEVASALLDAGLVVVGIERELVGGECPYWGCIPSKMAVRAAGALAEARRVPLLAGDAQVRPDYAAVAHRIRAEATDDWDDAVAVARFEKAGGRFLRGAAVIEGRGRVRVGGGVVTARRGVVVATGSAPVRPPIPGCRRPDRGRRRPSRGPAGCRGVPQCRDHERRARRRVHGAELLVAVGRRPSVAGLGLEHYGIDGVAVDARMRAADGLWAVGDVTGVAAFTHLAVHQGRIAAADILGRDVAPADYTALPRVTFTDPEIGSVGLTEAAARDAGLAVSAGSAPVSASSRGFVHGPGNAGLIKLVVDTERDLLVGATAAGPAGGEVLGMLALAVHARVPVTALRSMIFAYPTFHRGVLDALAALS
jgi:pyruvate/2-oxoglutarate dehydrogenase complex dihydrolipoamide dehydrogenase (E3) component